MSEQTVETKEKKAPLTVKLKPVKRSTWLPDGHDGHYKFTGCETILVPFREVETGQLNTGLTDEDEVYFEKKLKLAAGTLNRFNTDYWGKFFIRIPKEGRTFVTNNPKDELDIKVLKANPLVADSLQNIPFSPSASFYLSSETEEAQVKNKSDKSERDAIKRYGQLGIQEMVDVLRVYSHTNKTLSRVSDSSSKDMIESVLYDKVKEDPDRFIEIMEDPQFKHRVLLDKLMTKKIVVRSGTRYIIHGGDQIGATLEDTLNALSDPNNQDLLISLKGKLQAGE